MEVYVTEVHGPHKFIVQPVATELISLMEEMGYELAVLYVDISI